MNTKTKVENGLDVDLFFKTIDNKILEAKQLGHDSLGLCRDKVAFFLMYCLGLRVYEVLSLNLQNFQEEPCDFMFGENVMSLRLNPDSPHKRVRHIPFLGEHVSKTLEWYLKNVRPFYSHEDNLDVDAFFLDTHGCRLSYNHLENRFKKILKDADNQNYTIRDLRKAGLAAMEATEASRKSFLRLVGHRYPSTTEGYNPSDPILKAFLDAHRKALANDCSDDNQAAADGEESSQ